MSENRIKTQNQTVVHEQSCMAWIVWGLACFFYFYECLLQVSPSVMSNELMHDFGVTSQTLGIFAAIYFYFYSAMQLPCGVLMDRFGPHRILTLATAVCALSTIAFGMTHSFFMASIARLMIGMGSAFAVVGILKLTANWFPPQRFAFLTGLMVTIGMLGAIFGEAPLALLISRFGWRESMLIMGALGLILAIFILLIIRDTPRNKPELVHADAEEGSIMSSLVALVKNKQLWLVASYGGLMYMATPVICGLWGVPFLMVKMGISKAEAANFISLIFVGWAVASPLWGAFSNRIGLRKPPLYIGSVGALISILLVIFVPRMSAEFMAILLLSFGIFSSGFLPAFAVAKEICDKRYVATGLSFMNMMNMIGIALIQPIIGRILDTHWTGKMLDGVRHYPVSAYQSALMLLPICIFIALLIMPFIKETYCHNVDSDSQH